jgi:hypothetical protein
MIDNRDAWVDLVPVNEDDQRAAERAGLLAPPEVRRWLDEAPDGTVRSTTFDPGSRRWRRYQNPAGPPPEANAA